MRLLFNPGIERVNVFHDPGIERVNVFHDHISDLSRRWTKNLFYSKKVSAQHSTLLSQGPMLSLHLFTIVSSLFTNHNPMYVPYTNVNEHLSFVFEYTVCVTITHVPFEK